MRARCVHRSVNRSVNNGTCESEVACIFFERSALNRVLTLAQECRGKMVQIQLKNIDFGAFCVELRPFYWEKKNSGPNVRYCVLGVTLIGNLAGGDQGNFRVL